MSYGGVSVPSPPRTTRATILDAPTDRGLGSRHERDGDGDGDPENANGARGSNRARRPQSKAGNGTRTRDPNLGKVVLYQLSYSRTTVSIGGSVNHDKRS